MDTSRKNHPRHVSFERAANGALFLFAVFVILSFGVNGRGAFEGRSGLAIRGLYAGMALPVASVIPGACAGMFVWIMGSLVGAIRPLFSQLGLRARID